MPKFFRTSVAVAIVAISASASADSVSFPQPNLVVTADGFALQYDSRVIAFDRQGVRLPDESTIDQGLLLDAVAGAPRGVVSRARDGARPPTLSPFGRPEVSVDDPLGGNGATLTQLGSDWALTGSPGPNTSSPWEQKLPLALFGSDFQVKRQPYATEGLVGLTAAGPRTLAFRNRGQIAADGSGQLSTTLETYDERYAVVDLKTLAFRTLIGVGVGDGTFLLGEAVDGTRRVSFVDAAGAPSDKSVEVDAKYVDRSTIHRMGKSAVLTSFTNPGVSLVAVEPDLTTRVAPWATERLPVTSMRCRAEGCLLVMARPNAVHVRFMAPDLSLGPETKLFDQTSPSDSPSCRINPVAASGPGAWWVPALGAIALAALATRRRLATSSSSSPTRRS